MNGSSAETLGVHEALHTVGYGLYILTTRQAAEVHAITCNWLTQISFDPVLVSVALESHSYSRQLVQASGVFAINVLRNDQLLLARRMAVPHALNSHKLAGVAHHFGVTGAPLLDDCLAFIECRVRQTLEPGGDHILFIADVLNGARRPGEPLSLEASRLRYK